MWCPSHGMTRLRGDLHDQANSTTGAHPKGRFSKNRKHIERLCLLTDKMAH